MENSGLSATVYLEKMQMENLHMYQAFSNVNMLHYWQRGMGVAAGINVAYHLLTTEKLLKIF